MFERPVGSLVVEKHPQRLADGTPRNPKELHDVLTIEVGALGFPLGLERKAAHTLLQVVHPLMERGDLVGVTRRAVTAHELVEVAKKMAGVARVPANRRVLPAVLVAVEPPRQTDEAADVSDQGGLVPEVGQTSDRHAFTDGFVMVEGHLATAEPSCRRLPDIVQECRKPKS